MDNRPAIAAENLHVAFGGAEVLRGASLALPKGAIVGLTGASGSGKSTFAAAMMGLVRPPGRISAGKIMLDGEDILALPDHRLREIRGSKISLIVQNPRAALHPMRTIARQIGAVSSAHEKSAPKNPAGLRRQAVELLELVGVNDAARRADAFAHELSGGMAQRALIAMALAAEPEILIADEPTSGLDVTVAAQFLDMMAQTGKNRGASMLLVTQEAGVLATYCDFVAEMADGRICALRETADYFSGRASLTRRNPASAPKETDPLIRINALVKQFETRGATLTAVNDVSLSIRAGETLGLVGESGSGKTTVGRCVVGLETPTAGEVVFAGESLRALKAADMRRLRAKLQFVRQDPFDSFNPRWTIGRSLAEPYRIHEGASHEHAEAKARDLLKEAGCASDVADARPRALSAGVLQRANIARAMATAPDFVVLDEPTSALAPSARGEIIALLADLQKSQGIAFLFISHDLTTIAAASHRIAVMYLGEIVELGTRDQIFEAPAHPYTKALIAAHLSDDPGDRGKHAARLRLEGEIPSPIDLPPGCFLASRCPYAEDRCAKARPQLDAFADGRLVRCLRAGEINAPRETGPAAATTMEAQPHVD